MWLFQWAFAATAATIVAGAVAERITFTAYLIYSVLLTAFVYPVCVHTGWGAGIFSAWREEKLSYGCGLTDFAGSGVVHFTGGIAALVGVIVLGPRKGRFNSNGSVNYLPQSSIIFQTLGTLILWFGWCVWGALALLLLLSSCSQESAREVPFCQHIILSPTLLPLPALPPGTASTACRPCTSSGTAAWPPTSCARPPSPPPRGA